MAGLTCRKFPFSQTARAALLKPAQSPLVEQRATAIVLYEKNKKGSDKEPQRVPITKALKFAATNLVPESKKWLKERKEAITMSPMIEAEHGNYEVLFRFNDKESVDRWRVTADRDNDGGYSTANFTFTKNRTGLFHGYLNKEVPKDGKLKYAGYANITSPPVLKSFNRETSWDWSLFNCLLMRVRGDGRAYMLVIGCDFYYDINWLNRWSCPLFTRGGPYWQLVKIPLTKFFTNHRGRIQDQQEHLPLDRVNSLGITVGDSAQGPYCLEIESISLLYDVNLSGKHAYEMYEMRNFEAQT